jgi:hypothetical protein
MNLQRTSTKLRHKAVEIISRAGRPLMGNEIENQIRELDKQLWTEISLKCHDYTRIILSMTDENIICKYKSRFVVKGVDRRAIYYGLSSVKYPEDRWTAQKKKVENMTMSEENPKASWTKLSSEVPIEDPIWNDILTAMREISENCNAGTNPTVMLQDVLRNNQRLTENSFKSDIEVVLKNEIMCQKSRAQEGNQTIYIEQLVDEQFFGVA